MIYRLVTFGESIELTLTTAESNDQLTACRELARWARSNGHRIAKNANDRAATCVIQSLELVN